MARGGGGGGSRSSGSRSSSRSSGGHRSSSSGRSSSSRSYSSSSSRSYSRGSSSRSYSGGSSRHRSSSYRGGTGGTTIIHNHGGSYSGESNTKTFIIAAIVLLLLIVALTSSSSGSSIPLSSYAREKLELGYNYDYNCVIDEAYWFDSPTWMAKELKTFYDKTGVQPYVIIKPYMPELTTDNMKEQYAIEYYESHFPNENVFLYMYFEERNDQGDGYSCYVNGTKIDSMMDSEAVDIFWSYVDAYWWTDMSSDDLYVKVFNNTADRITSKSKTLGDSIWIFAVIGLVVVSGTVVVVIMNKKRAAEKARAEEDAAILNADITPIQTSTTNPDVEKYLNQ